MKFSTFDAPPAPAQKPGPGVSMMTGTVRSRAEAKTATAKPTLLAAFNLLDEINPANVIGFGKGGKVSFYCIDGGTALPFTYDEAMAETKTTAFTDWVGNAVAVLTCIDTP